MNIVFFSSLLPPDYYGGAEILTLTLAEAFAAKGHTVTIYTGGPNRRFTQNGVEIIQIPELRHSPQCKTSLSQYYATKLHTALRHEGSIQNADIIHAIDLDSITLLSYWKEIQDKFVVTMQDYGLICPAGDLLYGSIGCLNYCHENKGFQCIAHRGVYGIASLRLRLSYAVRKLVRDKVLDRLKNVICVSNYVAQSLLRIHKPDLKQVIPNCLSDEWFIKNNVQKTFDILYVGRLEAYKGIDVLLHAIHEMKNPDLHVGIVGGGSRMYYENIVRMKGLEKNITFFGIVDQRQIRKYYQHSRVIVVPSIWPEPCGRTIIEGMASGVPVVATRTGGTPESMVHGKHGYLIPAGNSSIMASTINSLLFKKKLLSVMGVSARNYAKKMYNTDVVSGTYLSFYRKVSCGI